MVFGGKRQRKNSDEEEYKPPPSVRYGSKSKRVRARSPSPSLHPTSTIPETPLSPATPPTAGPSNMMDSPPLILPDFPDPPPPASPPAAGPLEPMSSPSQFEPTPVKELLNRQRMGRPPRSTRRVKSPTAFESNKEARTEKQLEVHAAKKLEEKKKKRAEHEAAKQAAEQHEKDEDRDRLLEHLALIWKPRDGHGGLGMSLGKAIDIICDERGGDHQIRATIQRALKSRGPKLVSKLLIDVPEAIDPALKIIFAKEGQAVQELFTRSKGTTFTELLNTFNMPTLTTELQRVAPSLWNALAEVSRNDQRENPVGRNENLVFTTVCAMVSALRSQKANNFQAIMSLFLIGSGAAKREMEVYSHAGFCLSYTAALRHLNMLSAEATQKYRQVIKAVMCSVTWDNLNIAFRVESQRLDSGNHFDNGTTATLIQVWDPYTESNETPHGTLPLSMKPTRTSTDPRFEWTNDQVLPSPQNINELTETTIWQLKRIALEHITGLQHLKEGFESCPAVDQITIHATKQYPIPAMHEEESSIDGTIKVYEMILKNLQMTNEDLEKHGLLFQDGDLLTVNLVDKVEAARRNSEQPIEGMKASITRFGIFHTKMAGSRLVLNEHWGKPNSKHPGAGLWWENNYLNRKNIVAGWQSSKAAPWKPTHELLQISLAAHVKDGFRVFCGKDDLEQWAKSATREEFDRVAEEVYTNLFSTAAYAELKKKPYRDTTVENTILYNRDALFYIELVHAVKAGDVGRVINILKVWMVMMRSPKTMPKYADAIFETLGRLATYPEKLRKFFLHNWLVNLTGKANSFKEIDLLQEHQNFWLKARSNRSWDWLSMVSVCIYEMRNAMRIVQNNYEINSLSTEHTVPDMSKEIDHLAKALADNKIQTYIENRTTNEFITPVRDLLEEGSKYPDTRGAFRSFRKDSRIARNLGNADSTMDDSAGDRDDGIPEQEEDVEEYEPSAEDLALDQEEPYEEMENLISFMNSIDE